MNIVRKLAIVIYAVTCCLLAGEMAASITGFSLISETPYIFLLFAISIAGVAVTGLYTKGLGADGDGMINFGKLKPYFSKRSYRLIGILGVLSIGIFMAAMSGLIPARSSLPVLFAFLPICMFFSGATLITLLSFKAPKF
jgi:hypothetical protein